MAADDSDIARLLLEAEETRRKRAEQEAVEFQVPSWEALDASAYGRAISPEAALARFPYDASLAITQLQRELKANRVKAICDEAHVFDAGRSYTVPYAQVQNWHWWKHAFKAEDDFWKTGYVEFYIPESTSVYNIGSRGTIKYFGVKFLADGLPSDIEVAALPSLTSNTADARPPLASAEARRVSKALLEIWGEALTEARALELAKGLCPDNRVARDPFLENFRAIRGLKKPGKPASRG